MLQNQISFFSVQVIGQIKSVENNERPILMFLWKLKNFKRRLIVMDVELENQGILIWGISSCMPLFQEDSWSHDAFRPITRDEKYLMNHNQNYSLSKTVNLRGKNEFTIINSHFIFPFLILHSLFHISYSISSILRLPFAFSNISFASHLRTSLKRQLDPFVPNITQYP